MVYENKGTTYCLNATAMGKTGRSCTNDALLDDNKKLCTNMDDKDGCYDCKIATIVSVSCVCSKDGCNDPSKTPSKTTSKTPSNTPSNTPSYSDSKIVALVPIITIIKSFILGIF